MQNPNPKGKGVGNYPEAQDNLFYQQQKQKSMEHEQQRGKPFPFYDNPYFNRGGSHNPTREQLYSSWQYEAADFEVDQVIEPGPKTEEVDVDGQKNPLILQHEDQEVLDASKLQLEASKLSFLPLLLGMGASALAGEAGAGMIGRGIVSGLVRGAMGKGAGGGAAPTTINNNVEQPGAAPGFESYSSIHEALSQSEHPSSIPQLNELGPEDVDPHEHEDGDHSDPIDDYDASAGGTDDPHGDIPVDGPVGEALEAALPALLHFYHSDESGADDPTIKALIDLLENEHPGTLDTEPTTDDLAHLDSLKTSKLSTGVLPITPQPGTQPGQTLPAPGTQELQNPVADPQGQVNPVSQGSCPNCGARVSPGQGVCPQCGSGVSVGMTPEVTQQGQVSPLGQSPVMGQPHMAVTDYRAHDEALRSLLARPDLAEHERQALNVAMAMRGSNMMLQNARERSWSKPPAPSMTPPQFEGMPREEAERMVAPFKEAASGGPTNPEQFKAVKDYLINSIQDPNELAQTLQDLIDNPGNYADILAQIQGQGDRPQPDPDPGVPPPMPDPSQMGMDPAAMGGMPPGGAPGGMPMQAKQAGPYQQWKERMMGQNPELDEQGRNVTPAVPPGHPMDVDMDPMVQPTALPAMPAGEYEQMLRNPNSPPIPHADVALQNAKFRQNILMDPRRMGASDSITPPCPNCGSHTTGMITDDGAAQCSACNHRWDTDMDVQGDKTPVATKAAADETMTPNPVGVPAADQTGQPDPSQNQNPNIWTDQSGQPLQVGQEYEMYSSRYDVPDTIRVTSLKPDSLEYTLTGTYGLEHRTAVSRQEAEMDGLTFLPTDQAEPEDEQPQPAENPMAAPADTHEYKLQASRLTSSLDNSWNSRLAGAKYTPMEQRELIDEVGMARNSEKLNLAGTHYVEEPEPDDFFIFGW